MLSSCLDSRFSRTQGILANRSRDEAKRSGVSGT